MVDGVVPNFLLTRANGELVVVNFQTSPLTIDEKIFERISYRGGQLHAKLFASLVKCTF